MSLYEVPVRVSSGASEAVPTRHAYQDIRARIEADPDAYWLEVTQQRLLWQTPPTQGLVGSFHTIADGPLTWFADGTLNVAENCLDRHLADRGDKTAILWEADEPGQHQAITYRELHERVCRTSNALLSMGIQKGDRVIIYMGMIPDAAVAMLACARIGAIHSVVFGGFSAEALRSRIKDCGAKALITQDEGLRAGRIVPLKRTADEALADAPLDTVIVARRTGNDVGWTAGRDHWLHELTETASPEHTPAALDAEHPLFILYTSGSTGTPKGVVHTSGGYLTYASHTHATVFDLREDDVFACMADVGWITGHTYIVYGPLANGATTLMFESTPMYPDAGRYWDIVQTHKVTQFYTAPTAIRALAARGDDFVTRADRSSLRVLGTVGEPINPDAWEWYHSVVGEGRCTIVDTWWQTETGGMMISPIAPVTPTKPGAATQPLPWIHPELMDELGNVMRGPAEGRLCIRWPWPGQARTVWGNHPRFVSTYFEHYKGFYFTGDGCRRDEDGYYWITGRVDDVINVSGHRMGTAEFESVVISLDFVAEAAVVGYPHAIKGQGVYTYIVLETDAPEDALKVINQCCRVQIGAHARIDKLQVVPGLPKTRSGKVMRRILRKVAEGQPEALGDISTLADPSVVEAIIAGYRAD